MVSTRPIYKLNHIICVLVLERFHMNLFILYKKSFHLFHTKQLLPYISKLTEHMACVVEFNLTEDH